MKSMKFPTATFLFLLLVANASTLAGELIRCPVTADSWVAVPDFDTPEPTASPAYQNHGADPQLPIQGYLSFALFQFDVSALKGRSIAKATLRVHRYNTPPVPLHTVGLSTISGSGPWSEGTQKEGAAARGAMNFYYARKGDQSWSFPGSDLVDVTFGQGGSLYAYERVRDAGSGWYEINVSPVIIGALVSGDQYGLILCDEKGQVRTNHILESRESRNPPVLIVEVGEEDKSAPGQVKPLQSDSRIGHTSQDEAYALGRSTLRRGSVILKFGGAGDDQGEGIAAHYELRCSEKPVTATTFGSAKEVPRWSLDPLAPKSYPLATSNSLQDQVKAVVEQLRPGAVYYFAARAVDKAGNVGPVSPLGRYRAYDRSFPTLPQAGTPTRAAPLEGKDRGTVRLWAVPELMKIDPQTGTLLERDYSNHRLHNAIWDGVDSIVHLTGARNEFVAFQLAIEITEPVGDVKVQVSKPLFPGSKLPAIFRKTGAIQLEREWFVPGKASAKGKQSWYPDALVPLAPTFAIPTKDNGVPDQRV
ncbi:MAG TPA: hypothetical protein VMW38_01615, partial [Terriglobia bacterium]|nr:hypothetical protein [Terriglobia bacterium]